MKENAKKYKCDDIPVIFYNFASEAWEPVNAEMEQACYAARYKNQLDEIERRKAANSSALYQSRTVKSEKVDKKSKSVLNKGFIRFIVLAAAFFAIWWWVATR